MRTSNLALALGAVALAQLLGSSPKGAERSAKRTTPSAVRHGPASARQPGLPPTPSQAERVVQASELACFSDGVSCAHALDCCSGGCLNGQCGPRGRSKRRLARR